MAHWAINIYIVGLFIAQSEKTFRTTFSTSATNHLNINMGCNYNSSEVQKNIIMDGIMTNTTKLNNV